MLAGGFAISLRKGWLWIVYRYDLLFPWPVAGISALVARINSAYSISVFAIAVYDFLACPGPLYKHLPKKMGVTPPQPSSGRRSGGPAEHERNCGQLLKSRRFVDC
jgi:hypothetical protein